MVQKRYQIVESPYGLCSDPAAEKAPLGALSEADNVVIRSDGKISPRNGAASWDLDDLALTEGVERLYPMSDSTGSDILLVGELSTAQKAVWASAEETILTDANSAEIELIEDHIRPCSARKNTYINTSKGIVAIESPGQDELSYAGVYPDLIVKLSVLATAGHTVWLGDEKLVSYRFTQVKTYDNGLIVESAPSQPFRVDNATGNTGFVYISPTFEYQSGYYPAGTVRAYNVYRTKQTDITIDPGDTMYFVGTMGDGTFNDEVPDDNLGRALYTNAGQEGIDKANDVPPYSKELAYFNNSLFFGNVTQPHTATFLMKNYWKEYVTGSLDSAGIRSTSGTTTTGSPVIAITEGFNTTGVEVGQVVYGGGAFTTYTYVLSKTADTITLSSNALTTGLVATILVVDTITVRRDGVTTTIPCYSHAAYTAGENAWNAATFIVGMIGKSIWMRTTEHMDTDYDSNVHAPYSTVVMSSYSNDDLPFEVWATHGEAYSPAIGKPTLVGSTITYTDGTGLESAQTSIPNGLAWSKTDKPEAVPMFSASQFLVYVGDSSPIHRIVALQDNLLIFKDDGLFSLSGYNADSGWTLNQLNTDIRLIRPDALTVVDDNVYAITTRGLVRIDNRGLVTDISRYLIHDQIKGRLEYLKYNTTSYTDCFVISDPKHNEVLFSFPYVADTYTQVIYRYNTVTNALTSMTTSGSINYLARGLVLGEPTLILAGTYIYPRYTGDGGSDPLWLIDETSYGRDVILGEVPCFYLGPDTLDLTGYSVASDRMIAILPEITDYSEKYIHVGDILDDGTSKYEVLARHTSDWSKLYHWDLTGYERGASEGIKCSVIDSLGEYLYMAYHDGVNGYSIYKVNASTWAVTNLVEGVIAGTIYGMCLSTDSDGFVYWCDASETIYRVATTGGDVETIASSVSGLRRIAADDTNIYYTTTNTIKYRAKSGGAESTLVSSLTSPRAICIDDGVVYWAEYVASGSIKSIPVGGGSTTTHKTGLSYPRVLYVTDSPVKIYYNNDNTLWCLSEGVDSIGYDYGEQIFSLNGSLNFDAGDMSDNKITVCLPVSGRIYSSRWDVNYQIVEVALADVTSYIPTIDVYSPIDAVVTWLPKYGPTRALRKHFYDGEFVFDSLDGLDVYESKLASSDSYVEHDVTDTTCRYLVPVGNARKLSLSPSIRISSVSNADWALLGLSLGYTAQAVRGVKH